VCFINRFSNDLTYLLMISRMLLTRVCPKPVTTSNVSSLELRVCVCACDLVIGLHTVNIAFISANRKHGTFAPASRGFSSVAGHSSASDDSCLL